MHRLKHLEIGSIEIYSFFRPSGRIHVAVPESQNPEDGEARGTHSVGFKQFIKIPKLAPLQYVLS